MSDAETRDIAELQQVISDRLAQLGYADMESARRIAHHLAEASVLARNFAEHTLPLFLTMAPEHTESIAQLSVSVKCDLEEIRDAVTDVEPDLLGLLTFLNRQA